MALPFPNDRFDVAVMALVVFFLPDPAKGVAEMARVVRPGGIVASYSWDMLGGGFPLEPFRLEMSALDVTLPLPPSCHASRMAGLRELWTGAGIEAVETLEIAVERTFAGFDDFWTTSLESIAGVTVAAMNPRDVDILKERLRARLPADRAGRIAYGAHANAIRGQVTTRSR